MKWEAGGVGRGRYLVDKIPTRVSLDISTPASRRPTRISFLVGY